MNIPVSDQPAAGPAGSPGLWAGWLLQPSGQGLPADERGGAGAAHGAVAVGPGLAGVARLKIGVPPAGSGFDAIVVPGARSAVTDDEPGELAAGRKRSGRTPRGNNGGADKGAGGRAAPRKGRRSRGGAPAGSGNPQGGQGAAVAGGGHGAGSHGGGNHGGGGPRGGAGHSAPANRGAEATGPHGAGGRKAGRRERDDEARRSAQARRDDGRQENRQENRQEGRHESRHDEMPRGSAARGPAGPGERGAGERGGAGSRAPGRPARGAGSRGNAPAAAPARPARGGGEAAPAHREVAVRPVTPAPAVRRPAGAEGGAGAVRRYAALDLGTNNCRLLIAEPRGRYFRVVDAFSRIVRLGEGVSLSGVLADAAMDRAIEALKVCRRKLIDRRVDRFRLIATEACRAAANGEAFLARVREEADLELEVVSRETEARLAVAGCASLVDRESDGAILFDIGGGSSELVWLDLRRRGGPVAAARAMRAWTSLPVGVVALADRYGGVTVTPAVFEDMVGEVCRLLEAFSPGAELDAGVAAGRVHFLGTSGTVTTLAGVHLGLTRYDRRRVDGTWLETADLTRMIGEVCAMPYEARVESPCIGRDRADLVIAGCAILEAIRRRWPCRRLRVADRGLREGILTELMAADRGHGAGPGSNHGGARPARPAAGRRETADSAEGAGR